MKSASKLVLALAFALALAASFCGGNQFLGPGAAPSELPTHHGGGEPPRA